MMKQIFLFSLLMIVVSCSSTRVNEKPDFTKTGKEAENEIEKFRIAHLTARSATFENDGAFTSFRLSDYKKTMTDISPKAVDMLDPLKKKENYLWLIGAAWLATAFIKDGNGNVSSAYWVGAGAFIGYSIYLRSESLDIIDQYNRDLKGKFSPSVGYNFSF